MSRVADTRPHPQLHELLRKGPVLASWGLAFALLAQSALEYKDLVALRDSSHTPVGAMATQQAHVARTSVIHIAAAHLFGTDSSGGANVGTHDVTGPTQAALILTGVVAPGTTTGAQFGGAMIGETLQKTRFVAVGGDVAPGVSLHAVYADRVILKRGDALEFLALPRARGAAGLLIGAERLADSEPSPPGRNLEEIRKAAASTAEHLASLFEATPLIDGSLYRGMKINPGADAERFARMGFRPGDVITHINGASADDPAALDVIATGRPVRVSVRRPEGIVTLFVNRDSSLR